MLRLIQDSYSSCEIFLKKNQMLRRLCVDPNIREVAALGLPGADFFRSSSCDRLGARLILRMTLESDILMILLLLGERVVLLRCIS